MSEYFSKVTTISDEYKYSNIQIQWPSNIICILIHAISRVGIYSDICSVNMWHPNIFRYSFSKLCGIQIYSDICSGPFYDIRSSLGVSLASILSKDLDLALLQNSAGLRETPETNKLEEGRFLASRKFGAACHSQGPVHSPCDLPSDGDPTACCGHEDPTVHRKGMQLQDVGRPNKNGGRATPWAPHRCKASRSDRRRRVTEGVRQGFGNKAGNQLHPVCNGCGKSAPQLRGLGGGEM